MYRPKVNYPGNTYYVQSQNKRRKLSEGKTKELHTNSEPNRPIYFQVKACFPKGQKDIIEGTLLFTKLKSNYNDIVECYTLKQIHKILFNLTANEKITEFIPLGFIFAYEPNKTLITVSLSNRLHVDNIWADFNIGLGEDLFISKRDYLPYTRKMLTNDELNKLHIWFWKIGCSRQKYIKGSKV